MENKLRRLYNDGRDQEIQMKSESHALTFVIAATQILIVICLFIGNPAWKGSLSLLFIGAAAKLIYKYHKYEEKAYLYIGLSSMLIGILLLVWFGMTK